jgi:hypothetical protein
MTRGKPFEIGNPGKPAGAKNKIPQTVKETVMEVFAKLQDDPDANLTEWAKKNLTEFYKLSAKLMPTEISTPVEKASDPFEGLTTEELLWMVGRPRKALPSEEPQAID